MTQVAFEKTSLIQELRLRRWARSNYISASQRNDEKWHPIVLDEMRIKDQDMRKMESTRVSSSAIVPLVQSNFQQTFIASGHIFHNGHTEISPSGAVPLQREIDIEGSQITTQTAE